MPRQIKKIVLDNEDFNLSATELVNVLPINKGGTGNTEGYIRAGLKIGATSGNKGTAEGYNNFSEGDYSHAEGVDTTSSGAQSHSEGNYTKAEGTNSHAEGFRTYAKGTNSHAEGIRTSAEGVGSRASGNSTEAIGDYSLASGTGTIARYENQIAIGKYNDNQSENIFEIGNGTDNSYRKNAMSITKDGDILAKNLSLSNPLSVFNGGTGVSSLDIGKALIGNGTGAITTKSIDNTEGGTANSTDLITSGAVYKLKQRVDYITNGAYDAFDTLQEIGAYLNDNTTVDGITQTLAGKASTAVVTTSSNGLMSYQDKIKLDGLNNSPTFDATGSSTRGVYINSDGVPAPMSYTLESDVPSNAKFTDTTYSEATINSAGLMSAIDKRKLELGIRVTIGQKIGTTLGESATSEGLDTVAGGAYSHAEGYETTANGQSSHTEGENTRAIGKGAHAEGNRTNANSNYAHAEGSGTKASELASHAEGSNTTASGTQSHAEGLSTYATGQCTHAEGIMTTAQGNFSHSEGSTTLANGNCSHAEGNSTSASGSYSHSEGYQTAASGGSSHAEGEDTEANGVCSHAEGVDSKANGEYSHVEGLDSETTVNGLAAHAEGDSTKASEMGAHAEGSGTIASGIYSHAEGQHTTASGACSHASGKDTIADYDYQFVCGKYNIGRSDTAFEVGNGTAVTKSNAFVVYSAGGCGSQSFNNLSSKKYKENILSLEDERAKKILDLDIVTFDYKDKSLTNCIGLIAEDAVKVEPYPVMLDPNGEPDSIDYSKYVPSLIKMIQIQQQEINELKSKLDNII